jgi:hypothetical protein
VKENGHKKPGGADDRSAPVKALVRTAALLMTDAASLWLALTGAYLILDQGSLEQALAAADRRIAFVVLVAGRRARDRALAERAR